MLRAIMDISAHAILLPDKPRVGCLGQGLLTSFNQPGGNATGIAIDPVIDPVAQAGNRYFQRYSGSIGGLNGGIFSGEKNC